MGILKASIRYSFVGQPMVNTLWYRTVPDNPLGIDYGAAAAGLGEWVRDNVVLAQVGQTRMIDILPKGVNFDNIEVQAYAPPVFPSLNPTELLNAPVSTTVNASTSALNSEAYAPEVVAIIRLICQTTVFSPGVYTPRGGYIAFGPLPQDVTLENGVISSGYQTTLANFSAALLAQASLGGGFVADPCRVGVGNVLDIGGANVVAWGFATVGSTAVKTKASWRRSRSGA